MASDQCQETITRATNWAGALWVDAARGRALWHVEVAAAMAAPQLPPSHWTTSSCQSTALPAHRPTIGSTIRLMGAKSGPRTPVSGPSPGGAARLWPPNRFCSSRHMAHGSQGPYLWCCPLCPADVYRHGIQWIASDAWSPSQVGTMGFFIGGTLGRWLPHARPTSDVTL